MVRLSGFPFEALEPHEYYGILKPHAQRLEVWETKYWYTFEAPSQVVQWMEGAGLTPYLEAFIEAYERKVAQAFRLPGGELLVSFPGLFLIAAT